MASDPLTTPVPETIAARLGDRGLRIAVLDPADGAGVDAYLEAVERGFLGSESTAVEREGYREHVAALRRSVGVWDTAPAGTPDVAAQPVATVSSWIAELTVPGDRILPSWAISNVTVAPTHRRRGVARAMLEGELAVAAGLGLPMAMLTVSEATIYGRYGFGPAAGASSWEIDTRRAGWAAPEPRARIEFADRAAGRRELAAVHERIRRSRPGDIDVWDRRWDQIAGVATNDEGAARRMRFVLARDAEGVVRGAAVYSVAEGAADFTRSTIEVGRLDADTDDAEAALWRFLLELDLVGTLKADLRPVDDPIRWRLGDQRAASERRTDHQWLRILDLPAALTGRGWTADGELGLVVSDPLGYVDGTWRLRVRDGVAEVRAVDALGAGEQGLVLGVSELSSLYLGGVRAETLRAAGRLQETTPGSADAADMLLRSAATPYLSVWY